MANEAQIRTSLAIQVDNVDYQSRPNAFTADVSVGKGPTPGLVLIAGTGGATAISLAALSTPGLCRVQNLSESGYVALGIYDGTVFFPLLELLPGESYVFRLYRHFGDEFVGTGTPADNNTLRALSFGGPETSGGSYLLVEAFEK